MTQFKEGDFVRIVFDIKNDGTMYGKKRGKVLQKAGETGYISRMHYLNDDIVYEVHFLENNKMIGCKEKELIDGNMTWNPPNFKKGDFVQSKNDLHYKGTLISKKGTKGKISAIRFLPDLGYIYEASFEDNSGQFCLVAEPQLMSF